MASWRQVQRLALSFPNTTEQMSSSGHREWLVNDKLVAWERPLRRADLEALGDSAPAGPILGVRTAGLEMKEALLAHDPIVFFTTPHFDGYPAVLVQLKKISLSELRDVVREAWLSRAPKRIAAAYLENIRSPQRRKLRGIRTRKERG